MPPRAEAPGAILLVLHAEVSGLREKNEVISPQTPSHRPGPPRAWPTWALREVDRYRFPAFQRMTWRQFDRVQVFTKRDAREIAALAPDVGGRVRINPFGINLPHPDDG